MKKLLTILFFLIASSCFSQDKKNDVIWVFHDTVTINKPAYNKGKVIAYYHDGRWVIRDTMFLINVLVEQLIENKNKKL